MGNVRRPGTVTISIAVAITAITGRSYASTTNLRQLKTGNTDVPSVATQTANLRDTATEEELMDEFNTQAGALNVAAAIPSGSQVTIDIWIRKTAAGRTSSFLVKVFLNQQHRLVPVRPRAGDGDDVRLPPIHFHKQHGRTLARQ